jgi:hypothetical protein
MAESTTYYIPLGSGLGGAVAPIKYAFYAPKDAYKGLLTQLGVKEAKQNESGLVFGANQPKPARVRINFEGGGSTTRFCDPAKVEGVTVGGRLNKKTVEIAGRWRNKKISRVTCVQG